jgi:hypothetical protein
LNKGMDSWIDNEYRKGGRREGLVLRTVQTEQRATEREKVSKYGVGRGK